MQPPGVHGWAISKCCVYAEKMGQPVHSSPLPRLPLKPNWLDSGVLLRRQPTWCKFLLLRWLNQHGTEPVCALNDLRVFGKSAAEDLEDRLAGDLGTRDLGTRSLADTPQPAVGTAWIPPIEAGSYGNVEPSPPVRLAPATAEVIETLSANASAQQEPVQPHPPQHAPPGMQSKPAEAAGQPMEVIPVQPTPDAGAVIPAGQRAVLVEPASGKRGHSLLPNSCWSYCEEGQHAFEGQSTFDVDMIAV